MSEGVEEGGVNGVSKGEEKIDVKRLLSVIPPPAELLARRRGSVREKRVRLRYDPGVGEAEAKLSPTLARELGVNQYVDVAVAGKKRFRLRAVIVDGISDDVVHVNPELMKRSGVADNSICTVRSA